MVHQNDIGSNLTKLESSNNFYPWVPRIFQNSIDIVTAFAFINGHQTSEFFFFQNHSISIKFTVQSTPSSNKVTAFALIKQSKTQMARKREPPYSTVKRKKIKKKRKSKETYRERRRKENIRQHTWHGGRRQRRWPAQSKSGWRLLPVKMG